MSTLTEHEFFIEALHNLVSGTFSLQSRKVVMHDGDTLPSDIVIQAELDRLVAEYDAQAYARNRSTEYPALAEQLDEIYHNGIASWKAVIKVTKDKYPKG
jgi:hypothetical protein